MVMVMVFCFGDGARGELSMEPRRLGPLAGNLGAEASGGWGRSCPNTALSPVVGSI